MAPLNFNTKGEYMFSEEFIRMSRAEKEALVNKLWDAECDRLYEEVYEKTVRQEMDRFDDTIHTRPWYEAEARQLATNLAEDATAEYVIKKNKRLAGNNKLDVDELVEDLTETFGDDRVFYIDENTDFSKLPNPFIDNSKNKESDES